MADPHDPLDHLEQLPPDDDLVNAAEPDVAIDNAADDAALRSKAKRRREAEDKATVFWRGVLASETGREELWRWLNDDCHAFTPAIAVAPNGAPDPFATAMRFGEQQVGLRQYRRLMALDPDGMLAMHRQCDPDFQAKKDGRR